MISGHGYDNPSIMLVGDWGSKEDLLNEKALSGYRESTLRGLFKQVGYDLNQTYRTLFIKDIIEYEGKSKKLKYLAIEKARAAFAGSYEEILQNEIIDLKPNVIVPLGDLALKTISGYGPIGSYRGSVLPLNPLIQSRIENKTIRVIPTYGPDYLRVDYASRVYVRLDIQKAVNNSERTDPIEKEGMVWVCRSVEAFRNFVNRMPSDPKWVTTDIETYLNIPTCISFCFNGEESVSIPLFDDKIDKANQALLWIEIAKILWRYPLVNQNIKYDWTIAERFGFVFNKIIGDTSLGFHLLYPELPKNLGFQNSIYTNLPYFKDESSNSESRFNPKSYTKDTLYLYNAKDALATWQIAEKQEEEMKEAGVYHLYHDKIVPLLHIYKKIDDTGIRIDGQKRKELSFKYQTHYEVNLEYLQQKIGKQINVRSAPQVGNLLYNELKFPMRSKTTEGGKKTFKTDKDTLEELIIYHADDSKAGSEGGKILKLIVACRKFQKLIEFINTPIHAGDIWKSSTNLSGTETGRTSQSKSIDREWRIVDGKWKDIRLGRSLQTVGKHGFEVDGETYDSPEDYKHGRDLRQMFVPRRGMVFVEGDLSQADARSVAVLSEDWDLLASFDTKPKIHAKTAALIYGIDASIIGKDSPTIPGTGIAYYDMGKRIRHAGNFKMGPYRLAQMTQLPFRICKEAMDKFHETNPKISSVFHFEIFEFLRRNQYLRTPFGRRRDFFGRFDDHLHKEGLAYIPQSVTGDAIKFPMVPLSKYEWIRFLAEIHDGLLVEIPEDRVEEYGKLFKKEVEVPIDFNGCSLSRDYQLTIPCELSWSKTSWGEMVDLHI